MKILYWIILLLPFLIKVDAQNNPYHNTKKYAQIASLPGAILSNCWGYTSTDGKEYAIVGSKLATNIYDVSDCGNPILKASITDGLDTRWREYKVYKNYLYSVSELDGGSSIYSGLKMFDLSQVANGTVTYSNAVNTDSFFTNGHTLSIDTATSRLYISGTSVANMIVYQLNPNNIKPTLLKKQSLPYGYVHDLYVINDTVYASHGNAGFACYKFQRNPDTLILLGYNGDFSGKYNHSSWPHPRFPHIYYCTHEYPSGIPMVAYEIMNNNPTGVSIFRRKEFKDPLGLAIDTSYKNSIYHNPHARDNELYISAYNDGVVIYDISEPLNPIKAAHYDSYTAAPTIQSGGYTGYDGAWGVYPYFKSGCHIVSDGQTGMHTFKLDFRKVSINGNVHLSQPGSGIIFQDSSNVLNKIFIDATGNIQISTYNLPSSPNDMKVDSADFEATTGNIYLTSTNGSKYLVNIDENGNVIAQQTLLAPISNTITYPNNIIVTSPDKGLVTKSNNGQRWKVWSSNTLLKKRKTAF
jgi:choice-of-anchor B domain-containing protein